MTIMPYATMEAKPGRTGEAPVRVTWAGNPWSLAGLCFLNLILTIITVGIYWFWSRSELRRYTWQMVRVNGEPLEYTGTGRELLIGYLKLVLFVLLPVGLILVAMQHVFGPQNPVVMGVVIIFTFALTYLAYIGYYRAYRYILSRTRWRGIAFGLGAGANGYAWTAFWSSFIVSLSYAWLTPWRTVQLRRRIVSAMNFGSAPFRFEGGSDSLIGPFAAVWFSIFGAFIAFALVSVLLDPNGMKLLMQGMEQGRHHVQADTMGILLIVHTVARVFFMVAIPALLVIWAWSWYEARKLNVLASATRFGGMSAHLKATTGGVFWLTVSNWLIIIFTLTILMPVTRARRLRYLVERMSFSGYVDMAAVARGAERSGTQGAGLEAAFSVEIF